MSINAINSFNPYTRPMTQHAAAPKFGAVLPAYDHPEMKLADAKDKIEQARAKDEVFYRAEGVFKGQHIVVLTATNSGAIAFLSEVPSPEGLEEYQQLQDVLNGELHQSYEDQMTHKELELIDDLNDNDQPIEIAERDENPFAIISGHSDVDEFNQKQSSGNEQEWLKARLGLSN